MCNSGLMARGEDLEEIVWTRLPCGRYSCEQCAQMNANAHKTRIMSHILRSKIDVWFLETYTAHRNARDFDTSVKNLRDGLKRLFQRKRDTFNDEIFFVKVWELHKNNRAHVHVLTNATLATRFRYNPKRGTEVGRLNDVAASCGLGFSADVVMLPREDVFRVVGYVTKYITKAAHTNKFPAHFRRVEYSRNWRKPEKVGSNLTWEVFVKDSLADIFARYCADTYSDKKITVRHPDGDFEKLLLAE